MLVVFLAASLMVMLEATGCGGGSGGGGGQTGPPGFGLSLQPSSLSLIPGVQQQATLSVNAVNGFNESVNGSISGLPSGVTVSSSTFSVLPGGTATFYFTAAAGASSGTVAFNASGGTVSASAQLPISLDTSPDFQISTGTNNVMVIGQSASEAFNISAVGYNGFSQPVSISFSGAPSGITFSPSSFTLQPGGASQAVTVTISSSATLSTTASFQVLGSAAGITHQLEISLNIIAAALNLSLQPGSLTVPSGSTNSFELQLLNSGLGTPIGSISLQISGAPSGVTVSPSWFCLRIGQRAGMDDPRNYARRTCWRRGSDASEDIPTRSPHVHSEADREPHLALRRRLCTKHRHCAPSQRGIAREHADRSRLVGGARARELLIPSSVQTR